MKKVKKKNKSHLNLFYYVVIVILVTFQLLRIPPISNNKTTSTSTTMKSIKTTTTTTTTKVVGSSNHYYYYNSSCKVSSSLSSINFTEWYYPSSIIIQQNNDYDDEYNNNNNANHFQLQKQRPLKFTDFLTFYYNGDSSDIISNSNNETPPTTITPICRIPKTIHPHFAHSMQSIYSCISWWQYNFEYSKNSSNNSNSSSSSSNTKNHHPTIILSVSSSTGQKLKGNGNKFTMSLLMYLMDIYGLKIRTVDNETLSYVAPIERKGMWETPKAEPAYLVQSSKHLNQIRDDIISNIKKGVVSTTTTTNNNDSSSSSSSSNTCRKNKNKMFPTIGILNREKTRSLLNSQDIANAINNEFILPQQQKQQQQQSNSTTTATSTSTTTNHPPQQQQQQQKQQQVLLAAEVKYFEGATFEEQVQYFYNTDIIISPHGAQLTGLIFMKSSCSYLLEIFPKRYLIPEFYGSLAYASNVNYSYLYLDSMSTLTHDMELIRQNFKLRESVRSKNLCPSIDIILDAVQKMIQQWQICGCF